MKKLIAVLFSAFAASAFAGNTYYADASVEASGDGLTPETAKKTIQEAVDLCATSGDTVKVAEGVYQDTNTCTYDSARAVVVITNKIHLVATGAKEKTIVKGAFDSTSGNVGPDAVRGVYVYYTGSGTAGKRTNGSIIEGFTVCNGASSTSGSGGGLSIQNSYAVNCIVSNCVAKNGGAFYRGTVIRCLVADCRATGTGSADATLGFATTFIGSIITRLTGSAYLTAYAGSIYNCTIVGNAGSTARFTGYGDSTFKLYNSIVLDNAFSSFYASSKPTASNCVFQTGLSNWTAAMCGNIKETSEKYFFAAPACGDWRPTASSGAGAWGDAALLKDITLPDELKDQLYLDFYGKPIPTEGPITCGAVQEVADDCSSLLVFDDAVTWEVANEEFACQTIPASIRGQSYVWTDTPGMFKVRKQGATIGNFIWCTLEAAGTTVRMDPTTDNWVGFVMRPNATNVVTSYSATKTIYVDASEKGSDETGNGTADFPYATIQKAVDTLAKASQVSIVVRKGTYEPVTISGKTPGGTYYTTAKIRIVAEDGPEGTSIVGGDGVRCAYIQWPSVIQGFTLTGTTGSGSGSVAWANSSGNGHLADCVITGNTGSSSLAYQFSMVRCRVVDNVMTGGSDIGGTGTYRASLINCEVVHSPSSADGTSAIGACVDVYFSSVKGGCFMGTANGGNPYYASILQGGQTYSSTRGALQCFFHGDMWTASGSGKVEDCEAGRSKCVNFTDGDFRLKGNSPALGMVTLDPVKCFQYVSLDMDGNPLKFSSLAGNTAGAHQNWSVEPGGLILLVR